MLSRDTVHFVQAAMRNPMGVGAIAPSSAALARRMVAGLEVKPGQAIVEFGPGTGPFTKRLRETLLDPRSYLGIERDPKFVAMLKGRYPSMRFVEGSAEHADRYVDEAGHERVAAIISGLPFASLPMCVQDGIVGCLDRMMRPAQGGNAATVFRTFQYVHAMPLPTATRFRRRMRELFGPCHVSRPVMWNLPPAVVLSWQR